MPFNRTGVRRLFDLMLRRADTRRRDVRSEVALHLELRIEQLVRQGFSPDDARREAERRFGQLDARVAELEDSAQRRDRRMTWRDWMDSVLQDVRYALRGLRREPAFTTFAVVTLALGIGANAAMYGVVERLLLRGPEHIRDASRVVRFTTTIERPPVGEVTFADAGYVLYANLAKHTTAFDAVAAYKVNDAIFGRGRDSRTIRGGAATAGFFPLLGVRPALGRFFTPDEDAVADPVHVAVLGDAFWRSEFRADPGVIGQSIRVNNETFTIVGVAPRGFTGVELGRADVWIPMSVESRDRVTNWTRSWNGQWLYVVGRLKPGVSFDAAGDDATRVHRTTYDGASARPLARARIGVTPIRFTADGVESNEVQVARWLIGVTLVVLLIACTNVANLLLARAIRRESEVGMRMALGAGRGRLVRLFVTESLLIATLGGVAALAVAGFLAVTIRNTLLPNIEWPSSPVSLRVMVVSFGLMLAIGLLVGIAPAAHAARGSLMRALQRGRAQGRRLRTGAIPTVLQAALTACLLIGAGLFVRSLQRAQAAPLGFESDRVLVAQIAFTGSGEETAAARLAGRARRREVWRTAMQRLSERSDVEKVAIAVGSPFGNSFGVDLYVPGFDSVPQLAGGGPFISAITADYFDAVGTKLLRGRTFRALEGTGTEPVTIVNQTMARTLWPREDALTKCLRIGADTAPCASVVGIVEDAHLYSLREEPSMQYYIPFGQEVGFGGSVLMIRPRRTPREFAATAIRAVYDIDASIDRVQAWPIRERIDPQLRPWKLGATIFSLGGALALLVAALGLYSVMSYSVAQRTHEMGVRMALGARASSIVSLVVRQGVILATVGIAIGIVVAMMVADRLQGLLFNTSPRDATIMGGAALVLLSAAAVASLWPALRAGRVDPIRALKSD